MPSAQGPFKRAKLVLPSTARAVAQAFAHRIVPLTARVKAKALGKSPIYARASDVVEISPAVNRPQPAAIALPGEFDRVLSVQEDTSITAELNRIRPRERSHGATVAYRIDNAVFGDGALYYGGGYEVIRSRTGRLLLPHNAEVFTELQLCTNYVIDRYFGHWLMDGLCSELLAEQRSVPALTTTRTPWLHEPRYREITGLKALRSHNARVERLWVVDDRGINHSLISRINQLRERLRSRRPRSGPRHVMLTRGVLGTKRNLVNSIEVHEALMRHGFEIIDPEKEEVHGIIEKLSAAEIAIAVEGSTQNHCWLAMRSGSTFIAIQPPTRFNAHGKMRADALGINWAYVVADAHPDGFCLPVDRLLRTIDEVARIAGVRCISNML